MEPEPPILFACVPPTKASWRKAGIPCSSGAGGVGSIPANSDALNVPSFRRSRFEMKLSPLFACVLVAAGSRKCVASSHWGTPGEVRAVQFGGPPRAATLDSCPESDRRQTRRRPSSQRGLVRMAESRGRGPEGHVRHQRRLRCRLRLRSRSRRNRRHRRRLAAPRVDHSGGYE